MLEDFLNLPPIVFRLLKLVGQVSFIAHLMASSFFWVGRQNPDESWYSAYWGSELYEDMSTGNRYLLSIYWAFTTMSTVGYGDVVPATTGERFFGCFALLLGVCIFAYVVGSIASLFDNEGIAERKMMDMKAFLRERPLPNSLKFRSRVQFGHVLDRSCQPEIAQILKDLPSRLFTEVVLHMNKHIVHSIPLISQMNRQLAAQLCWYLLPMMCLKNDVIINQGELGQEMFFLISGEVQVFGYISGELPPWHAIVRDNDEKQVKTYGEGVDDDEDKDGLKRRRRRKRRSVAFQEYRRMGKGEIFGEQSIFKNTKRTATVRALTVCELCVLHKESLMQLSEVHPQLAWKLTELLATRTQRTDFKSERKLKSIGFRLVNR
eukprot:TRINITY_DN3621_c0_g1_i6.p1 TRINITY_DN3621_c0_g1~~TRINITY_DN3621_c0_g1_i6.p1  ORF type:complete len:377 (-),score=79.50 TRINITY_DN3621_c0_g1_i6:79-1209(-)